MKPQFTDAQIRAAMLKAAEHIERRPKAYKFENGIVPTKLTDTGCALAWIGHFLPGCFKSHRDVAYAIGCDCTFDFYDAMDMGSGLWHRSAGHTASAIRQLVKDSERKERARRAS